MPYRRTPAIQARLDAQRRAVLVAAVAVLAEHGNAGCSMAAVAARAGISTGSLYAHFASKAELVVELFRMVASREVSAFSAAAGGSGDPAERTVAAIETFARRALKSPRTAYALLTEPVGPAVEAERLVFRRAFRDVIAAGIAEGVASGALPPQDPALTAAALVGAVAEALVGPLGDSDPGPDVVPGLIRFALRAMGAP